MYEVANTGNVFKEINMELMYCIGYRVDLFSKL